MKQVALTNSGLEDEWKREEGEGGVWKPIAQKYSLSMTQCSVFPVSRVD